MSMEPTTQIEMPRYKCHKEVWALKIAGIIYVNGSCVLEFEETDYSAIRVSLVWVKKHDPQVGGYYVTYEDGYSSFSPAKAFEDGYTRV